MSRIHAEDRSPVPRHQGHQARTSQTQQTGLPTISLSLIAWPLWIQNFTSLHMGSTKNRLRKFSLSVDRSGDHERRACAGHRDGANHQYGVRKRHTTTDLDDANMRF